MTELTDKLEKRDQLIKEKENLEKQFSEIEEDIVECEKHITWVCPNCDCDNSISSTVCELCGFTDNVEAIEKAKKAAHSRIEKLSKEKLQIKKELDKKEKEITKLDTTIENIKKEESRLKQRQIMTDHINKILKIVSVCLLIIALLSLLYTLGQYLFVENAPGFEEMFQKLIDVISNGAKWLFTHFKSLLGQMFRQLNKYQMIIENIKAFFDIVFGNFSKFFEMFGGK